MSDDLVEQPEAMEQVRMPLKNGHPFFSYSHKPTQF